MTAEPKDRVGRKKRLQEFYGQKGPPQEEYESEGEIASIKDVSDPANIDSLNFNCKTYFSNILTKCDLSDLIAKEVEVTEQIRSLDSEMQTLVYDNYNKFIYATHTIKMMKSDFKYIEDEMNSLAQSMVEISQLSSDIDKETHEHREQIKKLTNTKQSLQKLSYLSALPTKIREHIQKEEWTQAVSAYCKAKLFFERFRDVPSFQGIDKDCTELINDVSTKIEELILVSTDANSLSAYIELLHQLGESPISLSSKYLDVAALRMVDLFNNVEKESRGEGKSKDAASETPQPISETHLIPDVLHFANISTDIILDGALEFIFAYINLFLHPNTVADALEVPKEALADPLFAFIKLVTDKFFILVESRLQIEAKLADPTLLIRALERLYSRLSNFGRSLIEVAAAESEHEDLTEGKLGEEKGVDETSVADRFKKELDASCLEMMIRTAAASCQCNLNVLRIGTADCFTDIRHQIVSNASAFRPGKRETNSVHEEADKEHIVETYNCFGRTLVTNLRDTLKRLEAFLSLEHSFSQIQQFRAIFALEHIREGLVAAYLRFLIQFCEDLSKCTLSCIPGTILLLTGKLCLDWANSGTVGHLLSLADDFLLVGLPKASVVSQTKQQAVFKQMQCLLVNRKEALTTPGLLSEQFRVVAINLFTTYVKFEGARIAHMTRKSVEARDWLKSLEPRSVRSVIRRILEDFTTIDHQVSQLLPPPMSNSTSSMSKFRSTPRRGDTRSWSNFRLDSVGPPSSNGDSGTKCVTSKFHPEYDHALASQLRRLFLQHVDIFAPVEANRESILFGVIKIGLKAFVECARTRTFGKFGLQQIQVDCHYLKVHLWKFVNDEKQIHMVLEDVMCSVMQRCVDPQLMDESIVDSICDTSRNGSIPSMYSS